MITFVKELENVIKEIKLEHIMLETDSPYLAPVPYRGKINQPAYVNKIAEKIAEIKNISIDEIEKVTTNNANLLFNKIAN
jgi:TatD DNase family protein